MALAAFEAAARHQSYTKAAEELAVTQSAVCRQIASLEEFLGVKLFSRGRRGMALTEPGENYARQVRARLDDVERDALSLMARGGRSGTLELGVVPTFATKWLIPRLPSFIEAHPGIQINITARTRPFLFEETQFDAAIHAGVGVWPGTRGVRLISEDVVPVCRPRLLGGKDPLDPEVWQQARLMQQSTRPYAWREWFASQGLRIEGDMAGPRLELFSMHIEAAIQGLGVALVPRLLVQDELDRRQLVTVVPHSVPSGRTYHLIFPELRSETPALTVFSEWLLQQLGANAV